MLLKSTGKQITMSKADAIAEITEIKSRITRDNFQAMAMERSDCGSFAQGGDLGIFGRGQVCRMNIDDAAHG
jgi:hypothetical protein